MKWDQIQNKWEAMACRVRADWPADRQDGKATSLRRIARDGVRASGAPDQNAGPTTDARMTVSIE